jgi:hypothetical protein
MIFSTYNIDLGGATKATSLFALGAPLFFLFLGYPSGYGFILN